MSIEASNRRKRRRSKGEEREVVTNIGVERRSNKHELRIDLIANIIILLIIHQKNKKNG